MDRRAVSYVKVQFRNSDRLYTYAVNSSSLRKIESLSYELNHKGVVAIVFADGFPVSVIIKEITEKPKFRCKIISDVSESATKRLNHKG